VGGGDLNKEATVGVTAKKKKGHGRHAVTVLFREKGRGWT